MSLAKQVALVTGAASGFGLILTKQLLEQGAKVMMVDRTLTVEAEASRLHDATESKGQLAWAVADVTDYAAMRKAFTTMHTAFKTPPTLVVSNAGIISEGQIFPPVPTSLGIMPSAEDMEREWHKSALTVQVNLLGVMCTSALATEFIGPQGGHILNVASMAGLLPTGWPAYSASKWGVVGFTRSLNHLWTTNKIRSNVICPSFANTPMVQSSEDDPVMKTAVKDVGGSLLDPDLVVEGMMQLILDEEAHGKVMRVTVQNGIDFQSYGGYKKRAESTVLKGEKSAA
eukprot:Clim_evm21s205 gene=Clim_evmTU21s205